MSYRKLIALTVFGAAVFLQGCEDDDEVAARAECSAANIDLSGDADPEFTNPTADNLFTSINTEAEDEDSKLHTQAEGCVACLLDEGATYQAAAYRSDGKADTTELDATNFDDTLNCWHTIAAMKDCGATTDLPACTGTPCASLLEADVDKAVGDCALCLDQQDTSDDDKLATAFTTCGLPFDVAVVGGCKDKEIDIAAAADVKFADLSSLLTNDPAYTGDCQTCIDEVVALAGAVDTNSDKAGCVVMNEGYTNICGGTFETVQTCIDNA